VVVSRGRGALTWLESATRLLAGRPTGKYNQSQNIRVGKVVTRFDFNFYFQGVSKGFLEPGRLY
jgi:hypothetical protein